MSGELEHLAARLREFVRERDWERFHTPKNLAMALAGEAGELVAEFQWLTAEESCDLGEDALRRVRAELGDVTLYLVRLADALGVDLAEAANAKLDENERRYDPETYRGSARKAPPLTSWRPRRPVTPPGGEAGAVSSMPSATWRTTARRGAGTRRTCRTE